MTEATLIPASDQVQLMLDSPMSEGELKQLAQVEARGSQADQREVSSKLDKALCLIEVYQDKLFRGKQGGRSWGDYLQSIDLNKLGYMLYKVLFDLTYFQTLFLQNQSLPEMVEP